MYQDIVREVTREVSGSMSFGFVQDISRFHRIQASPGFRQAAEYAFNVARECGVLASIEKYPADFQATYWGMRSFNEWCCSYARLSMTEPDTLVLADFLDCPISLVQRSSATREGGIEADVVLVDDAEQRHAYDNIDVSGKVVFARGDVNTVRRAAADAGAIGLITDQMSEFEPVRTRMDLPDSRQYTSFWPIPEDQDFFGFVLTPRQGERLRHLLLIEKKHVRVKAEVLANTYPGEYEVVNGCIPGTSSQEVWAVAHLCHPKPSANDNASGAGVLLECIRVLNLLIGSGRLAAPKRSIRFLLVPEMTGTYCFAAHNEHLLREVIAAVNLDMVGENQELCKGSLIVEKPPRALGSYAGELLAHILSYIAGDLTNLANTSKYSSFRHTVSPFSGGSDHYILSDPTVGIACPMLIQWPDKFYHTSADTLDKVDPKMLARVATLTASYLYFLANAGPNEAKFCGHILISDFERQMCQILDDCASAQDCTPGKLEKTLSRLEFLLERRCEDMRSLNNLAAPSEQACVQALIERLQTQLGRVFDARTEHLRAECTCAQDTPSEIGESCWDNTAKQTVPRRKHRGPVDTRGYIEYLPKEDSASWFRYLKQNPSARRLTPYVLYWSDGIRTLWDIACLIEKEIGVRDVESVVRYYEILRKCGLIY